MKWRLLKLPSRKSEVQMNVLVMLVLVHVTNCTYLSNLPGVLEKQGNVTSSDAAVMSVQRKLEQESQRFQESAPSDPHPTMKGLTGTKKTLDEEKQNINTLGDEDVSQISGTLDSGNESAKHKRSRENEMDFKAHLSQYGERLRTVEPALTLGDLSSIRRRRQLNYYLSDDEPLLDTDNLQFPKLTRTRKTANEFNEEDSSGNDIGTLMHMFLGKRQANKAEERQMSHGIGKSVLARRQTPDGIEEIVIIRGQMPDGKENKTSTRGLTPNGIEERVVAYGQMPDGKENKTHVRMFDGIEERVSTHGQMPDGIEERVSTRGQMPGGKENKTSTNDNNNNSKTPADLPKQPISSFSEENGIHDAKITTQQKHLYMTAGKENNPTKKRTFKHPSTIRSNSFLISVQLFRTFNALKDLPISIKGTNDEQNKSSNITRQRITCHNRKQAARNLTLGPENKNAALKTRVSLSASDITPNPPSLLPFEHVTQSPIGSWLADNGKQNEASNKNKSTVASKQDSDRNSTTDKSAALPVNSNLNNALPMWVVAARNRLFFTIRPDDYFSGINGTDTKWLKNKFHKKENMLKETKGVPNSGRSLFQTWPNAGPKGNDTLQMRNRRSILPRSRVSGNLVNNSDQKSTNNTNNNVLQQIDINITKGHATVNTKDNATSETLQNNTRKQGALSAQAAIPDIMHNVLDEFKYVDMTLDDIFGQILGEASADVPEISDKINSQDLENQIQGKAYPVSATTPKKQDFKDKIQDSLYKISDKTEIIHNHPESQELENQIQGMVNQVSDKKASKTERIRKVSSNMKNRDLKNKSQDKTDQVLDKVNSQNLNKIEENVFPVRDKINSKDLNKIQTKENQTSDKINSQNIIKIPENIYPSNKSYSSNKSSQDLYKIKTKINQVSGNINKQDLKNKTQNKINQVSGNINNQDMKNIIQISDRMNNQNLTRVQETVFQDLTKINSQDGTKLQAKTYQISEGDEHFKPAADILNLYMDTMPFSQTLPKDEVHREPMKAKDKVENQNILPAQSKEQNRQTSRAQVDNKSKVDEQGLALDQELKILFKNNDVQATNFKIGNDAVIDYDKISMTRSKSPAREDEMGGQSGKLYSPQSSQIDLRTPDVDKSTVGTAAAVTKSAQEVLQTIRNQLRQSRTIESNVIRELFKLNVLKKSQLKDEMKNWKEINSPDSEKRKRGTNNDIYFQFGDDDFGNNNKRQRREENRWGDSQAVDDNRNKRSRGWDLYAADPITEDTRIQENPSDVEMALLYGQDEPKTSRHRRSLQPSNNDNIDEIDLSKGAKNIRVFEIKPDGRKVEVEEVKNVVAMKEDDDGPDSGYAAWSAWGQCSVTCGLGRRHRSRACDRKGHCASGNREEDICSMKSCQ